MLGVMAFPQYPDDVAPNVLIALAKFQELSRDDQRRVVALFADGRDDEALAIMDCYVKRTVQ